MSDSMRIPRTGHAPVPHMATRVCEACRSDKPMMIHFQRDVTQDFATVIYTCRVCPHQSIGAQITLDQMSRPSGQLFSA